MEATNDLASDRDTGGTVVTLVQARLSSSRLPGKVLRNMDGRPMLAWLLDRLTRCELARQVVVTTSTAGDDDRLADWCGENGVRCHRGPLDDVVSRMLGAAAGAGADVIVRVSGDSPLLDPAVVDEVVAAFREQPCDLATNVHPRSFPVGQSVEVFAADRLSEARAEMIDADELEHVTQWFYRRAGDLTIHNVSTHPPVLERLAVDTVEDWNRIEPVVRGLAERGEWSWMSAVDAVRRRDAHMR